MCPSGSHEGEINSKKCFLYFYLAFLNFLETQSIDKFDQLFDNCIPSNKILLIWLIKEIPTRRTWKNSVEEHGKNSVKGKPGNVLLIEISVLLFAFKSIYS